MGWFTADKARTDDVKLTAKEKIKFLTEKPSSKDFGKSRDAWKASKDAAKEQAKADKAAAKDKGRGGW